MSKSYRTVINKQQTHIFNLRTSYSKLNRRFFDSYNFSGIKLEKSLNLEINIIEMLNRWIIVFILFSLTQMAHAQLLIDTSKSANYLVREVLTGKTDDLVITRVSYTGAKESLGLFTTSLKYNDFFTKGIIMSSGSVWNAPGPNDSRSKSYKTHMPGDNDIDPLSKGKTYDAAVLNIDFISLTDSIAFRFLFASEEYPEYVYYGVNDMFAFFLINDSFSVKKNLALLPKSNKPVSIDNVNSTRNRQYYIENAVWDRDNILKWRKNLAAGELAFAFQYDGFSTLLHAGSKVVPFQPYRLKMVIADVGDNIYDSSVFLEAGSFKSKGTYSLDSMDYNRKFIEFEFGDKVKKHTDSMITVEYDIHFEFDAYRLNGKAAKGFLDRIYQIMKRDTTIHLEVHGHSDETGTREYNRQLSIKRANQVAGYLSDKGIQQYRIKTFGWGYDRTVSHADSTNRRVEFVFKDLQY